jgi:hypothetical protein
MLMLASLILLGACQKNLNSNACLIFDDIVVLPQDEKILYDNREELSFDFLLSLRNYKDLYKLKCQHLQTN